MPPAPDQRVQCGMSSSHCSQGVVGAGTGTAAVEEGGESELDDFEPDSPTGSISELWERLQRLERHESRTELLRRLDSLEARLELMENDAAENPSSSSRAVQETPELQQESEIQPNVKRLKSAFDYDIEEGEVSIAKVIGCIRNIAQRDNLQMQEWHAAVEHFLRLTPAPQFNRLVEESKSHPLMTKHINNVRSNVGLDHPDPNKERWTFADVNGNLFDDMKFWLIWLIGNV